MAHLRLTLSAVLVLALAVHAGEEKGVDVVDLTELNFDELTDGGSAWMIDIYAPWCPACREMEPAWRQLARELAPDVRVGRIDGTVERGLLTRFSVQHFPSIYHVHSGEVREYAGDRTTRQMAAFARGGWRSTAPRTGCSSPVSTCGRMVGEFTKLPAKAKRGYRYLHEERHYGVLTLFSGLLAVPVVLGLSCICLLDAYYSRKPLHLHAA